MCKLFGNMARCYDIPLGIFPDLVGSEVFSALVVTHIEISAQFILVTHYNITLANKQV